VIEKKFYYPEDFTFAGFITELKNANMVNTPVTEETWIAKTGTPSQMVSASVTEYGIAPNGDIKPFKSNKLVSSTPITQSQIGIFDPALLIRNTDFIKPQAEFL